LPISISTLQFLSLVFLSLWLIPRICNMKGAGEMDYQVYLDPTHSVIRITITAEIVTPELAEEIRIRFARVVSSGGPFAAIVDGSRVTSWTEPAVAIREAAFRDPAVPGDEPT
jgi:hypothetical protein